MSGFSAANDDHLIRSNLWSREIKEVLLDELIAQKYVRMLTDFPDGDTLNIPSIGQAEVLDYVEGNAVRYTSMDTGNFTFTIDQYKSSATYITNKMKQDTFYMNELVSSFVPKQARALAKSMEVKILSAAVDGQTNADSNTINNAKHRFIGSGTSETIDILDFAKAQYALQKANVPLVNLVAIVDPSVAFKLGTQTNLINFSNNPQWEGVVKSGAMTGTRFMFNVWGFDVYVSENLAVNSASETIDSVTAAAGVNNLFFSAASDVLPLVGLVRQAPKVDSEYNKDMQREEYVTTCRYGYKLYRPENMVIVVTDTDQVYA
jgi:hypothetical protein